MIDFLALDLLGSHVVRRAQELPLHGQIGSVQPGDAEIGDLDLAVLSDEDVRRLDIPVNDSPGVGIVEPLGDLRQDVDRTVVAEGLRPLQQLLEVRPLDELHGDEAGPFAAFVHDIVNGDDVRMRQDAGALSLADEPAAELGELLSLAEKPTRKVLRATWRPISGSRAR